MLFARANKEIVKEGKCTPEHLMKDERDELESILMKRLEKQESSSSMPSSEVAKIQDGEDMASVIEPKEINIDTPNSKKRLLDDLDADTIS